MILQKKKTGTFMVDAIQKENVNMAKLT